MPKRCPPNRLFAAPDEILCEIHKPMKTYRSKTSPMPYFPIFTLTSPLFSI